MKVLGIGESVIDEISVIAGQGDVVATSRDAGGPVLVALLTLAKLGADCTFITTLGNDEGGEYIRGLLSAQAVNLEARGHDASKVNLIIVDEPTGAREKLHSSVEYDPIADLEPAFLQEFDAIIMDRHERQAFYEVKQHMSARTVLVIDPSTELSAFTLDMMNQANCPIVPLETLAQIEGPGTVQEAVEALHRLCGKPVVVTLGEFGSLVYDGAEAVVVPGVQVRVVNALGAGDVYRAAFAYGQLQGWALVECARYANVAAALQCEMMGNAADVPARSDIERALVRTTFRDHDAEALEACYNQLRRDYLPLALTH
ncbi:MAG TPA: carbohydrate kinase family protein [Candidatus Saccharimonadia bacterium]|jgi:sugar/nucleoside kinase (ribokinase family)|nr:carbohydrate kinase family protein [Candidatus Saccharimonadia bacterium]